MRRWRVGVHLHLRLQEEVVNESTYINQICKLAFCVQNGNILVCNAVATFLHVRLLSVAECMCGLLIEHRRLAVMFRHGRWMVLRRWIAEGSVLVGVF